MGTNYYFYPKPPCESCGRDYERIHIGKSSIGWVFSLHIIPEDGINDLGDWERVWARQPSGHIEDEYGNNVPVDKMLQVITDRSRLGEDGEPRPFSQGFFQENNAEVGPNGLARSRLDTGYGFMKHGDGTWDCFSGEFC